MKTVETIEVTHEMLASTGKRFANYLIDDILLRYLVFIVILTMGELLYDFGYESLYMWVIELSQWEELAFISFFLSSYYVIFETFSQRTLGKYITGTMVVMEDGSKPTFKTVFLRTLCRLIPFDGFSFLKEKPRGWHDRFVKTCVVDVKVYSAALELKRAFEEIGIEQ
ncbi:RDD family protein [Flavobacterium alkalisoli]|uniref:RDD family protein n=1 Tax=Flavobacterium alkalisoli TaxID=2602769 RepID=A0A5B9FNF2_9FLAO|nr:RDD family protein [Flavobacterium alkalisoli]QEE48430.1 RDD family protein [Flavobacterium alkalisoli]